MGSQALYAPALRLLGLERAVAMPLVIIAGCTSTPDHGHPRQTVVDQLLQHITRSRDAVEVPIASGQERFRAQRIDEAIYATGWDGSIIVTASEEEAFSVKTQR